MNGININLTITSPDLHDAFLALAEAINNMGGVPKLVPDPTVSAIQQEATALQYAEYDAWLKAQNPNTGVAVGKVMENDSVEVAAPVKAQKAVEPEPAKEKAAITLEAVRALAMKKSKEDKAAVKAAIVSVGGTRVTDVDPAKYPEFVALLEAI